jgi:alkanesulfonate monooxygenase SsuD/methylene tetrahydromethanopterin reductase-like flavin-dependent oxidoreductase (luciferase family)
LRFSLFHNFDAVNRWHEYDRVLQEVLEIARLVEDAGFWCAWYPEQHFALNGIEASPNPILLSAWIAGQTSTLRVGQAANIITQWHPLRLAEDLAVLDHACRGRLEVGLGRGFAYEAVNFNKPADVNNEEQNRELFDETLEIMLKAWTEDSFSHRGKFYEYPVPGQRWSNSMLELDPRIADAEGNIVRLGVRPQPFQKPHPPLWQVIDSERSIRSAAARGIKGILWLPPVGTLKARFEVYRDAAAAAGQGPMHVPDRVVVMRDTYVAHTDEQARRDSEAAIMRSYQSILGRRGVGNLLNPGEELTPDMSLTFDFIRPRSLLVGSPGHVIEKIHELREELDLEHLMIWSSQAGMPHDKVMSSLALFAEEVMPVFQSEPLADREQRRLTGNSGKALSGAPPVEGGPTDGVT